MRPWAARVRPGRPDDIALLGPIEVRAGERFRAIGLDVVADDDPPPPEVYTTAVAEGRLWVAERGRELLGYALAVDLDGQAHLEQVSVVPEAGGHGVGVALVDAVVGWAEDRGATSLTLSTFRDVPWNGPWYERLGFEVDADAVADPRFAAVRRHEAELGLDLDARVVMRRPLHGWSGPAPGP